METKRNSAARFAFLGLLIAALGCVATGLLGIVQGTVALNLYTPPQPGLVLRWIGISAAVFVVGLAVYAILNPTGVRRFLSGRQARYGSDALIMAIAFVAILVLINVLVYQNPWSKDVTEDLQHTLAPQTVRALATLPDKVTAIAFYSPQTSTATAKQLLENFKSNSKGKFDYRFVDPNSNPVLAHQYGVTSDGKVVLVMGKASETASFADETDMTQAMVRLISPQARTVYFLTGHGEPDINGSGSTSLSRAKQTLESKNYTVKSLNLAAENKIPEDAKALIEVGPVNPMLDQEVTLIKAYLAKGGGFVLLEDPTPFTKFGTNQDPLSEYVKSDWGISFDNDVVIDPQSNQPFYAISASRSDTSPITQHLTAITVMPEARSLQLSKTPPQGVALVNLIATAQNSWGETNLAGLQQNPPQVAYDQNADIPGPLTVGGSGEKPDSKSRLVAFGNAVFATDAGFDAYANSDLFVNSVDWVAQQGNLINITPRTPITRTFNPPPQLTFILIMLGAVIVIPGLVVAGGLSNWLARRRRG